MRKIKRKRISPIKFMTNKEIKEYVTKWKYTDWEWDTFQLYRYVDYSPIPLKEILQKQEI